MREPSDTYRLRDLNTAFIQHLKDEMRANPVHSVSPLIGMITVDSDEDIDSNHIEGYTFETLGQLTLTIKYNCILFVLLIQQEGTIQERLWNN